MENPTIHKSKKRLKQVLDRVLDKGIVTDIKLRAKLGEIELLRMRALTILSSFETAAERSIELPSGVDYSAPGWKKVTETEACPQCNKRVQIEELKESGCPFCGFRLGQK